MRVNLVYLPSPFLLDAKVMPPLGILHLAAVLEKEGHEPKIIDLAGEKDWQRTFRNEALDADIVGITATTPQYPHAVEAKSIVKAETKAPVILGGVHATSIPENCVNDFDSIVLGEGERAILKICKDVENGDLKKTYKEPLLPNLDALPYPARHLLDIRSYHYMVGGRPATTLFTQRGCPYSCSYCESPLMGSFTLRFRSPKNVAGEIKECMDRWGFSGFHFFDDEFNLIRDRTMGICKELTTLDVRWRCFVVAAKADHEMLTAMKNAGCVEVAVGFETGSDRLLKNIHKPATREINLKFAKVAHEVGIRVKAFMIVGLPGESWDTVQETRAFLREARPDDVNFSILQVYPGSPIAQHPEQYDVKYGMDWGKMYHVDGVKRSIADYEQLIQVRTSSLSEHEIIEARDQLEQEFKPSTRPSSEDYDRHDIDEVLGTML